MYPWKWFILGIALLSVTYFVPSLESKEAVSTNQELIADRGHHGGWRGHHGHNRHYDNWGSGYYFYSTPSYYYRRTYYYPDSYYYPNSYYYYSDPYYYYYPERRSGVYFRFGG